MVNCKNTKTHNYFYHIPILHKCKNNNAYIYLLRENDGTATATFIKINDSFFSLIFLCSRGKHEISEERISLYQLRTILVISQFESDDVGTYTCVATNTLGKAEGTLRLYGSVLIS